MMDDRAFCEGTWNACVAKHRRDRERSLEALPLPRWLARLLLWRFDRRMAATRARMVAELERRVIGPRVMRGER